MKKEFISLNQKDFKLYLDVRIKLGKISDKNYKRSNNTIGFYQRFDN